MGNRSFLKDFVSVGLSKILMILFGLASTVIIARYIGPEGNGVIAALIVYPSLFMSFGSLGISQSVTYFLGQNLYEEFKLKIAITYIWFLSSTISFLVCWALLAGFTNVEVDWVIILLALLPIPFTLFNTYNMGLFLGKNQIKQYNSVNWLPIMVVCMSNVLFVIVLGLGIKGALLSAAFGPMTMSIFLLFKNDFHSYFGKKVDFLLIKKLFSLGLVYAFSLLIINLNYKIDVILLDQFSDKTQLGLFSRGMAIAEYLWQIPMLFSTLVFARSASTKNPKEFSFKVARLLRLSFLSISILSVILLIFANQIINLLYGEAFQGSVPVLQLLLPGVVILTIFKVMNMDLAGKGKPWIAVKAMLPALIVNVAINLVLIPSYGAIGSAIASALSYSVAGLVFLYFYSCETKMPIMQIVQLKKDDFDMLFKIFR